MPRLTRFAIAFVPLARRGPGAPTRRPAPSAAARHRVHAGAGRASPVSTAPSISVRFDTGRRATRAAPPTRSASSAAMLVVRDHRPSAIGPGRWTTRCTPARWRRCSHDALHHRARRTRRRTRSARGRSLPPTTARRCASRAEASHHAGRSRSERRRLRRPRATSVASASSRGTHIRRKRPATTSSSPAPSPSTA